MKQTNDLARVASVLRHPSIFKFIGDDYTPHDWQPQKGPVYLMPDCDGACISFQPMTATMWEVHAAVLPAYRKFSKAWARQAADWMAANTPCRCILAFCYAGNYASMRLIESIGFKQIGTVPRSKLRGGILLDQRVYALSI